MHELPITKSIFKSVIAKAESVGAKSVRMVALEIGVLRDFIPEFVQKYWNYITPGSIAEGSVIQIKEIDATASCGKCGTIYRIDTKNIQDSKCPECGYDYGTLITGRELKIVGIEIESCKENKVDK